MKKKSYAEALREFEEKLERIDVMRKPEAKVFQFPPLVDEQELCRRQRIIDQHYERVLAEKRELEKEAARSCHRGSGDSDSDLRTDLFWPGRRR